MPTKALDLVNQIFRRVSWPTVATLEGDSLAAEIQKTVDLLNVVAQEVGQFYSYPFLRRTGIIVTVDDYTTGKARAVAGSNNLLAGQTGTQPTWTQAMVGRWIQLSDNSEIFRIRSVNSSGSLTIYPVWTGSTHTADSAGNILGVSYKVVQDTYALEEDFDRPFNVTQFIASPSGLIPIDFNKMQTMKAQATVLGTPKFYTIIPGDDGKDYLVLEPSPDEVIQIRYDYVRKIEPVRGDEDELPFPLRMEGILVDGTVYLIKRDQANDMQSATLVLQEYLRKRAEGTVSTSTTPRMTITPSTEQRQAQNIKLRRWGTYDYGDSWDKFGIPSR